MKQFCSDNYVIIGNLWTFSSVVLCYRKLILKAAWLVFKLYATAITKVNDTLNCWCTQIIINMGLYFPNSIKRASDEQRNIKLMLSWFCVVNNHKHLSSFVLDFHQ